MPLLAIENLSVDIAQPAGTLHVVRGIDLSLERGEVLGIVGESGSGKSMTALALMRLLPRGARIAGGRITLEGTDLAGLDDRTFARTVLGRRIGMIFQEPMTSLNPVYTVGRQLTEAAVRFGGMAPRAARERALALLERVGIPDPEGRLSAYPHQLSGGQRQRVMIAMALMLEPEILIADEPTTALDVTVQAQILELLAGLRAELGMAMILISHDLAVISGEADRVAVVYGGEIVEAGTTAAVMGEPRHPYTRALLEAVPRMDGPRRVLAAIPGAVPVLSRLPQGCIFAPRCPYARPQCETGHPALRGAADHAFRCVLDALPAPPRPAVPAEPIRHPAGDTILEARDVSRIFRTRKGLFGPRRDILAVDGVSLALGREETLAVVGESGSGKSTLARMLLGLDAPTAGEILMDGRLVGTLSGPERAAIIQPVFQDPYASLNPRRTVVEIIERPIVLRGEGTGAERRSRAREAMELVRLPERFLHAYPTQLSGGQRQRVAIARALISRPRALLCDEPTSALDVSVQAQILNLLAELRAEFGLACLLITHDMAVVRQIADRVAVMWQGRLVETGSSRDILERPRQDYTRRLLDAAPRFHTAPPPAEDALA